MIPNNFHDSGDRGHNIADFIFDRSIDFASKFVALLNATGRYAIERGKHKGKYECPNCGETKLSAKEGKGVTCYGCGHSAADMFRQLKDELGLRAGLYPPHQKYEVIERQPREKELVLTADEWENSLLNLLKYFPLLPEHRRYLKEVRGMSDRAIDNSDWFSIPDRDVDVTGLVHKDMPGTRWKKDRDGFNRQFLRPRWVKNDSGEWEAHSQIFHTAHGPLGHLIGGQALCPGIEKAGAGNKYRYLYDKTGGASNSKVKYNQNYEQVLTYESPLKTGDRDNYPEYIFATDSVAGKPTYASTKHGIAVMGIASANFASSRELVYFVVLFAIEVEHKQALVLSPDYGDFPCPEKPDGNTNMVGNWIKFYFLVRTLFPSLQILVRPSQGCDLDEDDDVGTEFTPFEQFLAIACTQSKKVAEKVRSFKGIDAGYRPLSAAIRTVHKEIVERQRETQRVAWLCQAWESKKQTALVPLDLVWEMKETEHLISGPRCPIFPDRIEHADDLDYMDVAKLKKLITSYNDNFPHDKKPQPKIIYQPGDRQEVLRQAVNGNLKYEFDSTRTGGGKSHDVLTWTPEYARDVLGADREGIMTGACHDRNRIIYMPPSPLNVSVENDFQVLPSRREYLHVDDKNNFYNYAKKNTSPIPGTGNCGLAQVHKKGIENGMTAEQLHQTICLTCPAYALCCKSSGTLKAFAIEGLTEDLVYGYLADRKHTLEEANQIIAHPSQPPQRNIQRGQAGIGPADIVILDDIKLTTQKQFEVAASQIDVAIATATSQLEVAKTEGSSEASARLQAVYDIVVPCLVMLKILLTEFDSKEHKYGLFPDQFGKQFGKQLLRLHPDDPFSRLLSYFDSETESDWWDDDHREKVTRATLKNIGDLFNNIPVLTRAMSNSTNPSESLQVMKEHGRMQWVAPFLWSFADKRIAVSVGLAGTTARLQIDMPDRSQVNKIKSAGCVLNLDATGTARDFARTMRVPESQVLHIEQAPGDYSNLKLIALETKQKFTQQRWGGHQVREVAAIARIAQEKIGKTALITHKRQVQENLIKNIPSELQGYWRRDNRGSNKYKDCDAVILVGSPIANMNSTCSEMQVQTGELTDYENNNQGRFFYHQRQKTTAEVLQAIGRLRANRTTDPRTVVTLAVDLDEKAIQERHPGITIEHSTVQEFCGVSVKESVLNSIAGAVTNSLQQGLRPLQDAIAETAGVTSRTVRTKVAEFGGWKKLVNSVNQLLAMKHYQQLSNVSEKMLDLARRVVPELFDQWHQSMHRLEQIANDGGIWANAQLEELANQMAIASLTALEPLAGLSPKAFNQVMGCMKSEDRQTFWEIMVSLEPVNFQRLQLCSESGNSS